MTMESTVEVEPKYLICPKCRVNQELPEWRRYAQMRVYRVMQLGVEVEWADGVAVYRVPGGDSLPFEELFGETEGQPLDPDEIDGDHAECLECGYEIPLSEVLTNDGLFAGEDEVLP